MSVRTQIDRLSANIRSAFTALAEKGAAVPDGANSDNLAELIGSIAAGVDISDSTVTPETLADGVIAYNAKGERIVGTLSVEQQIEAAIGAALAASY